jgi:hypothetical protein
LGATILAKFGATILAKFRATILAKFGAAILAKFGATILANLGVFFSFGQSYLTLGNFNFQCCFSPNNILIIPLQYEKSQTFVPCKNRKNRNRYVSICIDMY